MSTNEQVSQAIEAGTPVLAGTPLEGTPVGEEEASEPLDGVQTQSASTEESFDVLACEPGDDADDEKRPVTHKKKPTVEVEMAPMGHATQESNLTVVSRETPVPRLTESFDTTPVTEGTNELTMEENELADLSEESSSVSQELVQEQELRVTFSTDALNSDRERSVSRMQVDPHKLAEYTISNPCRIIIGWLLVFILVCFLDTLKFEMHASTEHGYFINSNAKVHKMDSMYLAKEFISDNSVTVAPVKTQNIKHFMFMVMWRKKIGGNILNSEDINYIVSIENEVNSRRPGQFYERCLSDVDSWPNCSESAIVSPFRLISNGDGTEVPQYAIDSLVKQVKTSTSALSSFDLQFPTTNVSGWYRGYFRFGLPFPDIDATHSSYDNMNDDHSKQEDKFLKWAYPTWKYLQHKVANKAKNHHGLELVVLSGSVWFQVFDEMVVEATFFAVFSILTVWIMMAYHLKSLFLSTMAMLQIVMGFPVAYFIYRYIVWVYYFDSLSTLIIFVILGIGADDVFVYTDAWEQSLIFVMHPEDLVERMTFAFNRASKAMLVTQLTTFFAFLGTTLSPVLPIRAFGIWAALIVMCNYILVITFYPAVLSFWYQNLRVIEHKYCCWCMKAAREAHGRMESIAAMNFPILSGTGFTKTKEKEPELELVADTNTDAVGTVALATSAGEYTPDLEDEKGDADLDTSDANDLIPAQTKTQMSSKVRSVSEAGAEETAASSQSPLAVAAERYALSRSRHGKFTSVTMRLRKPRAHTQTDFEKEMESGRWIERFLGTTFVDVIFMLKYVLLFMYATLFCVTAFYASKIEGNDESEKWYERSHHMSKARRWPTNFYGGALNDLMTINILWGPKKRVDRSKVGMWDTEYVGEVQWDPNFDLSPPSAQQHVYNACRKARTDWASDLYDPYGAESFSCFMYPLMAWVNETYNGTLEFPYVFDANDADAQRAAYTDLFRDWVLNDPIGNLMLANGDVGYLVTEHKLYYVTLSFSLTNEYYIPIKRRQVVYKRYKNRIHGLNDEAAAGNASTVAHAFFSDQFAFSWMVSARAFATSAVQGIGLALPLAFIILIFSTQNWIISVFAASTIVLILTTEVALMVWQGWKLGVGESVAVVIMIGFSVDYVVHLGNAYVECEFAEKREERIRFAMFTMGISVIYGALTTFGSGIFLTMPKMIMFQKFGILIMSTVAFSLLFALTYFVPLLAALGPEGKQGFIPVWRYVGIYVKEPFKKWMAGLKSDE